MMQSHGSQERPYRSHLRPACLPCRRRKSRCKIEAQSATCLMCRTYGTECTFPGENESNNRRYATPRNPRSRVDAGRKTPNSLSSPSASSTTGPAHAAIVAGEHCDPETSRISTTGNGWVGMETDDADLQVTPLSIDDEDPENPHIVGPANTGDSQVLADYFAVTGNSSAGVRMVRLAPASRSKPVLFSTVQKHPLGVQPTSNRAREKLRIIEHLIAPHADQLLELYFSKSNTCFPLLDKETFAFQYRNAKEKISPALLACLYAHSLIYWPSSPVLAQHRAPDNRFVWNLANDALYFELHLSPGISTATAILVNVGGRPTTSLIGNGVQLGAAVSLAHSLGLNRDPIPWNIPDKEKLLRMKIWWTTLIHDKWSSLAHGTPPHIQRSQYDVASPEGSPFFLQHQPEATREAASVFVAFFTLTEVLDECLQRLYCLDRNQSTEIASLELKLDQWLQGLEPPVRRIITRGTHLDAPGAANLRLAYLALVLLLKRIELDEFRDKKDASPEVLATRYIQARRSAEEIQLFAQDLDVAQLQGFWHPVSAFIFPSTVTFLLRCALETENSQEGVAKSSTLRLASDIIQALRAHRDTMGWEVGDICLDQYAEVVERLMTPPGPGEPNLSMPELQEMAMNEVSFLDEPFASNWDPTFRDLGQYD